MPGINFVLKKKDIKLKYYNIEINEYHSRIIVDNSKIYCEFYGYFGYPLQVSDYKGFTVIVEGMIYNYSTQDVLEKLKK